MGQCKIFKGGFRTYNTLEKGKKRLWGQIIDQKGSDIIVYNKKNPVGSRIIKEKCRNVVKWIDDGVIF